MEQAYQGKLSGILDLQDEIARDVAANLRLRLTGEEDQRLAKRFTDDPEAYLLYREATYHWNKFTEEGLNTSIEYCRRALKKDPNYAAAYAQLGRCYVLLGTVHLGPRKTFSEARTYLAKALSIDETLAEAHAGMGLIYLFHDWDWQAAERELKQAAPSDPSRAVYGFYLAAIGRPTDAAPGYPTAPGTQSARGAAHERSRDGLQLVATVRPGDRRAERRWSWTQTFPLRTPSLG